EFASSTCGRHVRRCRPRSSRRGIRGPAAPSTTCRRRSSRGCSPTTSRPSRAACRRTCAPLARGREPGVRGSRFAVRGSGSGSAWFSVRGSRREVLGSRRAVRGSRPTARFVVRSSGVTFEAVVCLEIHAQLVTASKIFGGCSTAYGAEPNTQVCPVCLGMPGSLPVLNRAAVDYAIRAALALGCSVHKTSVFARKNYFYPDLPKGYQISQYELPLATRGLFEGVRITRVHLEEDAGKSLHEGFPDSARKTYVDFNRTGVPLIEIVTEPDLRSGAAAADFFTRLREVLVWLGVNDGNMEEGSLRCDANVSVRRAGEQALGTKAEVKNLNSFRFLEKALEHEIERQIEIVGEGGHVVQETRLWDAAAGRTVSMRTKEEPHDSRYVPDPDLRAVIVDAARIAGIRSAMPELPAARRKRLAVQYALPDYDANHLTQSRALADYFESVVAAGAAAK